MKIYPVTSTKFSRQRQGGMAVIVVLAIISIILVYVGANVRSLYRLEREIKLTNQRQVRRLEAIKPAEPSLLSNTNTVSRTPSAGPESPH